jgi:hypothetical protein
MFPEVSAITYDLLSSLLTYDPLRVSQRVSLMFVAVQCAVFGIDVMIHLHVCVCVRVCV